MAKDSDRHGIDDEQSNELSSDQSSAFAESILKSTAVSKVKCFLRLLVREILISIGLLNFAL